MSRSQGRVLTAAPLARDPVHRRMPRVTAIRTVRRTVGTEIWHERPPGSGAGGPAGPEQDLERRIDVLPAGDDDLDRPPLARTMELQRWEGTVQRVDADSFTATLVDLTLEGPDETATFPIEEVATGDRDLVRPGAVFYWWVGYRDSAGGRARESRIRFQRLPGLSESEYERVRKEAALLADRLNPSQR